MKNTILLLACLVSLAACTSYQRDKDGRLRDKKIDSLITTGNYISELSDTFGCSKADIIITKQEIITINNTTKKVRLSFKNRGYKSIVPVNFNLYILDSFNRPIQYMNKPNQNDTNYTYNVNNFLIENSNDNRIGTGAFLGQGIHGGESHVCEWFVSSKAAKIIQAWPHLILYEDGTSWFTKNHK